MLPRAGMFKSLSRSRSRRVTFSSVRAAAGGPGRFEGTVGGGLIVMWCWYMLAADAARSLSLRREVAFSSASTLCMPLSPSVSVPGRPLV